MATLIERVVAGEIRAAARLMRNLDDGLPEARATLRELFPRTGRAWVVGLTGAPGAGKSSLTDRLVAHYRRAGQTVGVVAVDPTSPFTGGAILGDRIRMQDHATDPGVFIRSLATRGNLGGLSRSTADVVAVLDAMGKDVVIVETVGVGQDEIEVAALAHSVVVVAVPGLGDDVQAIKAGVLEIADVFAVNKADRSGAPALMAELKFAAHLHHASATSPKDVDWEIPVLSLEAQNNVGVAELLGEVRRHRAALESTGALHTRRRARLRAELEMLLVEEFRGRLTRALHGGAARAAFERVMAGELDPYAAAAAMLPVISLEGS
jgi:LAO/AO transport system kinase